MYIMCVCLFSALSRRVGALQISIIPDALQISIIPDALQISIIPDARAESTHKGVN